MSEATDLFIESARAVSIAEAAERLGLRFLRGRNEHPQPCPACGGTDRFAFNTKKGVWNCRGGAGGRDAISLAAHVLGLDVRNRAEFLEVCHAITGDPIPDDAETMTGAERAAHRERLERRRAANAVAADRLEAEGNRYREGERSKARGIVDHARPQIVGTPVLRYLQRRLACAADRLGPLHVRYAPAQTFWHGVDERGHPVDIHQGPAMIGRFEDRERAVIGCHITWIDLDRPPKFRPELGRDDKGRPIPSKKMRGTKKGGLIPVAGDRDATRWVVGEGIESAAAIALVEEFRGDTFYCAAGDEGNMAGPATARGRTRHPHLTRPDKNGRERPVMLPSPFPDADRIAEGIPVDDHVRQCVLLGENDSERYATAANMARARARVALLVPECLVSLPWPPPGFGDFCDVVAGRRMAP